MISKIITFSVLFGICAPSLAQILRTSVKSGNWSNKNTWDCACVPAPSDHARISTGHLVTLVSSNTITNLTIAAGATLTDNGLPNTIAGNLVVRGTYSGSGLIRLTGINTTLDGTGTISNTAAIQLTGDKTILPSAQLTINSSNLAIQGCTITNQGTITVGSNIDGLNAVSVWVNDTNATLNIGGSSGVPLLATGTLHAFAVGNTVNYYAAYAHTLKLPSTVSGYSTYHHLKISGSNTKTLPNGDVAVNGDLTINSTFNGSGSLKKLFLRGNWINNGNFTEGTGQGTVTFDGTTDQRITRAATENLNVLVVNKTSGTLIINTSLIAERGLTLVTGNIDMKGNTLTLGLSTAIPGTLAWSSGTIIGKLERWIATAGVPALFPIGTATDYRPALVQCNTLTPGSVLAEFITSSPGQNGLPLTESTVTCYNTFRDGYWSLTATNGLITNNVNLELTGNGFTGFTITDNSRLLTRASASNPWSLNGTHVPRAGNTVRRANVSVLSGHYGWGDDTNCTAPATSVITGLMDVCTSTMAVSYAVTNNAPNTYTWQVIGGTIVSGNNTNSIGVDWGSSGIVGRVAVVERNTCTAGAEVSIPVNVHALPVIASTGKMNVPENGITAEPYSVTSTPSYSYTWNVTGGTIASGQGTNAITVKWGNSGTGSVCVIANHMPTLPAVSCGSSVSACSTVVIYKVINSSRSGNWQTAVNWDCSCVPVPADNVTIKNTHAIALNSDRTINHVTINPGGVINTNSNTLTVAGDLSVNGILSGTGPIVLSGANTTIDGIGVMTNTGVLNITAMKTILPTATLTKNAGDVNIGAGVVVTNTGTITLGDGLNGTDNNSQWINAANATLNIAGNVLTLGKLFASAPGNTVRFFGAAAQSITLPASAQYANLTISDTGAKTASAAVTNISGDFTNQGNFQHNNGTVNFNNNSEVSGSSVTTFYDLDLATGSALTFPTARVQVEGNISFNSGSMFDATSGTIELNGTAIQSIDAQGAGFYTLEINKPSGTVEVSSLLPILHTLEVKSATPFNTNNQLVIRSLGNTTNLDGSIGPLPTSTIISGNVTVERYMHPIGRTFRYVTSPVDGALPPPALGSAIYEYGYTAGISSWRRHELMSPMIKGIGYAALVPGGSNPATWSVSGPIHQGDWIWNFNEEGWHLIGNPYPSAIQWRNDPLAWTLTNIATTIAVTDNAVSGYPNYFRYWSYDAADNPTTWGSGELPQGEVAMAQAFWVYAGAGGGSLTIKETAKSSAGGGQFYRTKPASDPNWLKITLDNGQVGDVAFLKVNPKATSAYEFRYDLKKLRNQNMNLFLIDESHQELVIHAVDNMEEEQRLPLAMEVNQAGIYHLSFMNAEQFRYGKDLYLIDAHQQKAMPIAEGKYTFVITDTSATSSKNRFFLARYNQFPDQLWEPRLELFPNPVTDKLTIRLLHAEKASIKITDIQGTQLWSAQLEGHHEMDMSNYPKGIYIVQLVTQDGKHHTQKIIR